MAHDYVYTCIYIIIYYIYTYVFITLYNNVKRQFGEKRLGFTHIGGVDNKVPQFHTTKAIKKVKNENCYQPKTIY